MKALKLNKDIKFDIEHMVFNYRTAGIVSIGKRFLFHKAKHESFWSLVGGRVRVSEDSAAALMREYQEELGVGIEVGEMLWSVENFFTYDNNQYHELAFIYSVTFKAEHFVDTTAISYGIDDPNLIYKWFTIDELKTLNIKPEFIKYKIINQDFKKDHIIVKD